ncbi:MAG TPA: ribosome maturation factor RimM [Terriglobales bacterium]|nr:ribosome maturation factor RimM [Terriglobales bacterium]
MSTEQAGLARHSLLTANAQSRSMTASPGGTTQEFVTLARVVKTQGRRGEVAVEVHSDIPDRLHSGLRIFALAEDSSRRELKIEDAWPHKDWLVLKFAGVDSISVAEALVGSELQVPLSERAKLEPGATFVSDLVGCTLFDHGREVGVITDVRFGAGEAPLLVVGESKSELEIPHAQEFLVRVDLDKKRIEMNLPEGLLEVNAPLTEEEKKQQRASSNER